VITYFASASWYSSSSQRRTSLIPASVFVSVRVSSLPLLGKGTVKCISPFVARQRLNKHVPAAVNTPCKNRIVGLVCLRVYYYILLSFLGNSSVKDVPAARNNWRCRFLFTTSYSFLPSVLHGSSVSSSLMLSL
jgi:hypothetical protein